MTDIFSCFWRTAKAHRPHRSKIRKTGKGHDEVARFEPNFLPNGQDGPRRGDDAAQHREETRPPPPSRQPSIESHRSPRATRSSRDELMDVEDQLFNWLNARKISFDQSQTAATSLLKAVFASHSSLWHSNKALEAKLRDKDAELRSCEDEINTAEQDLARLEQRIDAERKAAEREVSRLRQIINDYKGQLTFERAETGKLVTAHANEVVILNTKQRDCEEQHRIFVSELTSSHQTVLGRKDEDHQRELRTLGLTHQSNFDRQEQQHRHDIQYERQKVKQAEEDMRMSVDHFQALQDDELRIRFYKLSTEVESLSRLSPVHDFAHRAQAMGVNIRIPDLIPGRDHKLLLQSALWAIIVDGIFRTPFQVFGVYGDPIHQTWTMLFGHGPNLDWPAPQLLVEKWRYTTADRIRRVLSSSSAHYGQTQQIQTSYHNNISALTSRLVSLFASPLSTDNDHRLPARFHDLLDQASTLAVLLSLERCRVRVFLPSALGHHSQRESEDVKDVYPGNEKEIPYATAEFVVAPGLSKEGNSRGGKLEERTVLSQAVVYFSPEGNGGVS